jgi:hypothetical protein
MSLYIFLIHEDFATNYTLPASSGLSQPFYRPYAMGPGCRLQGGVRGAGIDDGLDIRARLEEATYICRVGILYII